MPSIERIKKEVESLKERTQQTDNSTVKQARKFIDFLVEWNNNEGLSPYEELELARKHGLEVTPEGVVKSGL